MLRPEMRHAWQGQGQGYVSTDVIVPNVRSREHALKAATWFAEKYNIPYTDIIQAQENTAVIPRRFGVAAWWMVKIEYHPESPVPTQ